MACKHVFQFIHYLRVNCSIFSILNNFYLQYYAVLYRILQYFALFCSIFKYSKFQSLIKNPSDPIFERILFGSKFRNLFKTYLFSPLLTLRKLLYF
jgi:hypothetical protein